MLKVLLLADTHVGFDMPTRPRISRRRGPDFLRGYQLALAPALRGEVDIVIHGGDLLFRSRVPPELVQTAMAPLMRVASRGTPVFLVPGNHERSKIPYPLLARHPLIHIFHQPHTFVGQWGGITVAVGGWPYHPRVRSSFPELMKQTGLTSHTADVRLLCVHQAIEGARVAPHDFTFRQSPDVVRCMDLPHQVAAVLGGHIHRAQVLTHDLHHRPLPTPVIYPGSVERTAMAERFEPKGYMELTILPDHKTGGRIARSTFVELPTRPMMGFDLRKEGSTEAAILEKLKIWLARVDPSAVIQVQLGSKRCVTSAGLRTLAPSTATIQLSRPSTFDHL